MANTPKTGREAWRAERKILLDQMEEISNRSPLLDPLPYKLFFHLLCGRLSTVNNAEQFKTASDECKRLSDEVFKRIADLIAPENFILSLKRGDVLIFHSEGSDPPDEFTFMGRAFETDGVTPLLGQIVVKDGYSNQTVKQASSLTRKP